MSSIETLSDEQRRLMAHIFAALRDNIRDEIEYDRTPDFAPLDDEHCETLVQVLYEQITALMVAAHAAEAATIEAEIAAYWANAR
jgi:hypothetical protein